MLVPVSRARSNDGSNSEMWRKYGCSGESRLKIGNRRLAGRIKESINLSQARVVRTFVRREGDREEALSWFEKRCVRRLAWSHGAVERLHQTAVDITVIGSVDCRRVLLVRVLRIGRWHVHYADRQLTCLVHETA